uniref:hypothetical protein n=1 Tax=Ningiella ruwaisensis TaxID=2364274 RepID=UPI00109F2051|nr:hypothetical protein [Ningiella ruwaisensis]
MNKPHLKSGKLSKQLLFYIIALFIPVLFFVLLEFTLRLFDYGKSTPLFIDNPANSHYILPRPDIMSRYFPDPASQPQVTLEANFLLKDKPENGLRIFVQGGSTAAGFPYGLGASLASTLDHRLKQALPGRHVEVVSTALSAVNSYTMLDLADEIIAQSPDAVLIYAGHNEFLGILGVGSHYSIAEAANTTLWFIRLKHLRTFQLIQNLFLNIQTPPGTQDTVIEVAPGSEIKKRTFMAKVAKQTNIPKSGTTFNAGISQFKRNMTLLLEKYKEAGIPVFIGTVASNQSDQAPFASKSASKAHASLLQSVLPSLSLPANKLTAAQRNEARRELVKVSESVMDSDSADLHFKLATYLNAYDLHTHAKAHYLNAIEHDLLRFRAPQAINDAIEAFAKEEHVYLVETLKAFEARSPQRIIGNNLMLEHLHPNLQGYFVLSESFYQAIKSSGLFAPFVDVPIDQAWNERLILPAEEYFGFATILHLKSDYPFVALKEHDNSPLKLPAPQDWQQELGLRWYEKKLSWMQVMERSLVQYRAQNNQQMSLKTLQILADALPHNGLYNLQLAEHKFAQNRLNEALHYYRRAQLAGAVNDEVDTTVRIITERLRQEYGLETKEE